MRIFRLSLVFKGRMLKLVNTVHSTMNHHVVSPWGLACAEVSAIKLLLFGGVTVCVMVVTSSEPKDVHLCYMHMHMFVLCTEMILNQTFQ
jgi:hypothetical protein